MSALRKVLPILLTFVAYSHCAHKSNAPLITNVHRGGILYEGPHWSSSENSLYWVDITGQRVLRLDGSTGEVTYRDIEYGTVSLVVSIKDYPGILVVAARSEVYLLPWNVGSGEPELRLLGAVSNATMSTINDGKADANGRLWFGTIGPEVNGEIEEDQGAMYMLDQYNYVNPEVKIEPVSLSNGFAWTKDNKYMFYIDSATRNVDVFDFDLETANIHNRRVLFSFEANNLLGLPDGMTIDSDENLWVACNGGGQVIKIDSRSGELLEQHKLPASHVTSVQWGGPDLATLYVTTSRRRLSPAELELQPEAGSLFAIQGTGARGLPEHQFVFPGADEY